MGIISVRNAAATIRVSLIYHMALGMERILVLDNGSTDGTGTILKRLQRRLPISVLHDDGPFRQDEIMTGLLHEAAALGADWVVPFDDDEFLESDYLFTGRLEAVRRDGFLVPVVNFVQHRRTVRESPRALLTMRASVARPVDIARAAELGPRGEIAVVEAEWPRKLILRASSEASIELGNHGATGLGELELADWCRFLHAPLMSPEAIRRSAEQGRRIRAVRSPDAGWQHFLMAEAEEAGRLDEMWRMNSVDGDLRVGPGGSKVVRDDRLADAVRPWIRSRPAQLAARLTGRSY